MGLFDMGNLYPHPDHMERISRYRENKKLFKGMHYDVFERVGPKFKDEYKELIYLSVNFPGLICKKSADFLFGESANFSAGKKDNAPEQKAIERLVTDNELKLKNYQSALGNAYRGDSFIKIRWGQNYDGLVDKKYDPFHSIIENQNPEFVFPEVFPSDTTKIMAYHIAYPLKRVTEDGTEWELYVETHLPGKMVSRTFSIDPVMAYGNEVHQWKITKQLTDDVVTDTGIPFPLVVHIPNYATDDSWEGIDDLTEHKAIFNEINNRLTKIAEILDKHSDPAIAVPTGTLGEDEHGNATFNVGQDKVFEIMGKDDVLPQYITWNGQLQGAFEELKRLIDFLLLTAELPEVALGSGDSGTSGSSGLAIKFRLNSLLAKINRKQQFYDRGLKQVLYIAQLLEHARGDSKDLGYEPTTPYIQFKDGLPDDEMELAQIMNVRTGGKATLSQKTAIMRMEGLTEEQAEAELNKIEEEDKVKESANPSIFNNVDFGEDEDDVVESEGEDLDE